MTARDDNRSASTFWVCLTCTVLLSGCERGAAVSDAPKVTPLQRVTYVLSKQESITDLIELTGRTDSHERVEIRSRVSGFLLQTHFEDGQLVNQGDRLFTIEPDEYQAIYNQALAQVEVSEAKLELAQKTFLRSKKLLESKAVSQEEYDQNRAMVAETLAQVEAAEATAARYKLDVDYTEIVSPITGRVDRSLLDDGNFVTGGLVGGTLLTTVINDRPIKAVANINEGVRLKFMRRQREMAGENFKETDKLVDLKIPCSLQLQDESDFPHQGTLDYVENQIDQQTGTSQIRAVFANEDGLLKTGMFVRLRVPVSEAYAAVLVPDASIGTDQATRFVYVINAEDTIESRSVELGDRRGQMRVIQSGLQSDEKIVVGGLQLIQPGMKVSPAPMKE